MQSWDYYVALTSSLLLGAILFAFAKKAEGFEQRSKLGKFGVQLICMIPPSVLIFIPYLAWKTTGFTPAEAREAERVMVARYIAQGAQTAEAHFVVSGHSTMTGFAHVTMPDGSAITTQCKTDKAADGGEYLIFCE
jgi:hypothetical protein